MKKVKFHRNVVTDNVTLGVEAGYQGAMGDTNLPFYRRLEGLGASKALPGGLSSHKISRRTLRKFPLTLSPIAYLQMGNE